MTEVVNRVRGSVQIEINGVYPERFINQCAANAIPFWKLEKLDDTQYRLYIHKGNAMRVQAIAHAQGCGFALLRQQGLPQFARRFKKRYALLGGLLAAALFIGVMGQFIWELEVEGNVNIPTEDILQKLAELGVAPGTYTGGIDERVIKNEIMMEIEELLWFAINIKGGRATVLVRERVEAVPVVPLDQPCNIVASETGVILRLDTLSGSPQVTAGQMVEKGQLLVSGIVDIENYGTVYRHAMAYAQARTWRDVTAVTPGTTLLKQYTGQRRTRYAIVILGRRYNFYKNGSQPFDICDKIVDAKTLHVPLGVSFPIQWVKEEYYEYETIESRTDEDAAMELLEAALRNYLSQTGGTVSDLNMSFENRHGLMGMRMTAELVEDIAQTVYIPMDEAGE